MEEKAMMEGEKTSFVNFDFSFGIYRQKCIIVFR